tara:strand:+ start:298 stop:672 length:375 start_codon:yes stop_codon:yes gene_type:complete
MAAPNIVNVTSIFGKTVYDSNVSTSTTIQLQNAANSGKVLKVNTIIAANIDGTNAADITVLVTNTSGTALFYLARTISVPADSSLVVISKDTSFYLEEDRQIRAFASASSDLSLMTSYEEIDDA